MPETWTPPFLAVTNAVISSSDANAGYRGNLLYLRQFLSANPGGANEWLQSTGTDGAAWVARATAVRDALATAILTANLRLANNISLQGQTVGAVNRGLAGVGPDDIVYLGDASSSMRLQTSGSLQMFDGANYQTLYHTGNLPSPGAAVPTGLIAAFRTAAAIASGWTRFTDGDGRLLVGAGTTFSVTYTQDTAYGSSWAHGHTVSFNTGTSTTPGGSVQSGGASTADPQNHVHPVSGSTADATWTPVARAVVYAIKT
jgi:hypothetical protein